MAHDHNTVPSQNKAEVKVEEVPTEGPPTLIISVDDVGDVQVGSQSPEINLTMAIAILELAQAKLVASYFGVVQQEKARIAATQPQLLVPNGFNAVVEKARR